MIRLCLVLVSCCVLGFLAVPGFGMIDTLPLPDLVRQAEMICIAKVVQVNEVSVDKDQVSTVKNVLLSEKLLKGSWQAMEPIVVMTRQSGKYGTVGSLEDQVEFPPKGSHVVLFLKKAKDGSLEPVNLLQGVWPLDGQKPLGMGLGITLQQLEEVVKLNR
ncbi:MAG TPA: hypothetical protein PKO06_03795 [Candidatus Ozemobacteraceae bacterium]|nr:hypothetical protein [Candidatus Ozemobacteraceae bacterium]